MRPNTDPYDGMRFHCDISCGQCGMCGPGGPEGGHSWSSGRSLPPPPVSLAAPRCVGFVLGGSRAALSSDLGCAERWLWGAAAVAFTLLP